MEKEYTIIKGTTEIKKGSKVMLTTELYKIFKKKGLVK